MQIKKKLLENKNNNIFFLQVTRLCDLNTDGNSVTSVAWSERGHHVAVGSHLGYVTVWDVIANKQVSCCFNFANFCT